MAAALTLTLSLDEERDRNWTGRRKSKIHRLTFICLISLDRARCVRFSMPRSRCSDRWRYLRRARPKLGLIRARRVSSDVLRCRTSSARLPLREVPSGNPRSTARCNCLRRLAKSSWSRSRSRANSSIATSGTAPPAVASGQQTARSPAHRIASVLVAVALPRQNAACATDSVPRLHSPLIIYRREYGRWKFVARHAQFYHFVLLSKGWTESAEGGRMPRRYRAAKLLHTCG